MFNLTKGKVFGLFTMFLTTFLFTVSCSAADPIPLGYVTVYSDATDNVDSSTSDNEVEISNDREDYSKPRLVRTNLGDIGVIPRKIENEIKLPNNNQHNISVEESESDDNSKEDDSSDNNKGNNFNEESNFGNSDYNSNLNQSIPDNDNSSTTNISSNVSSDTSSNTLSNNSSQNYSSDASSVSNKKSSSSNSKSAVVKTGEDTSYLPAIMLGSLILSLFFILERIKKFKIRISNENLKFFCTIYTMMLRVVKKLGFYSGNKEVFSMFDFLKKSRAFKFLCSSCLVCALGSFVSVYGGEGVPASEPEDVTTHIGETYVQGLLGFDNETLVLEDTSLTADGRLSGTLKWKTTKDGTTSSENVFNSNEDAELVLFLKRGGSFVAASKSITPDEDHEKGLNFKDVQLYAMDNGSEAIPLNENNPGTKFKSSDGLYDIFGLVNVPGTQSIILSNDAGSSDVPDTTTP